MSKKVRQSSIDLGRKAVVIFWWEKVGKTSLFQDWSLKPTGAEVNPGDNVTLSCLISNKAGDCR